MFTLFDVSLVGSRPTCNFMNEMVARAVAKAMLHRVKPKEWFEITIATEKRDSSF